METQCTLADPSSDILQAPFSRALVTSARADLHGRQHGRWPIPESPGRQSPVASASTQFVLTTATNDQRCPHVDLGIYAGQRHVPLKVNGTHQCRITSIGSTPA